MQARRWSWLAGLASLVAGVSAGFSQEKLAAPDLARKVDKFIAAKWDAKVKPADLAEDAEFLRRVYLDLGGRIPSVAETRAFLADPSASKRIQLVERLLDSPLYVNHFGTTYRQLILPQSNQNFRFVQPTFKIWLDNHLEKNTPLNQVVFELLTPQVPQAMGRQPGGAIRPQQLSPAFTYYQVNEQKPENLAASVSRTFLGVSLDCAQCHNHPFARWTREQFWEMAAFFSLVQQPLRFVPGQMRPEKVEIVRNQLKIPGTDKVVRAKFLDGQVPKDDPQIDPRVSLASWVTSKDNPYFARNLVNRTWAHFFGYGLNDPLEDEPTDENPTTHPEVLDSLTQQFIGHDFDLKYLIRTITSTRAYQRSSRQTDKSQAEPKTYARMHVRGLSPEQLFDSLAQATGYRDPARFQQFNGFVNPNTPRGDFLSRFASQERAAEKQTSILQALNLMNGKFISDATSVDRSTTLAAVADMPFLTIEQKIEALYLATMSRQPRAEELQRMTSYAAQSPDERTALADVFWALLNSSEFIVNK